MRQNKGFTLLELIAVVTIISVLITIALMLIPRIRNKVEIMGSMSNLRTAYSGILAYAADHEGRIPANRGVLDEDLGEDTATQVDEIQPGLLDLPYVLSPYIPERTFLSPGNKRHPQEGYYLAGVASSYLYKGMGQRLDGYDLEGRDMPVSAQVLLSEIRAYYDGKACQLAADGRVLTNASY